MTTRQGVKQKLQRFYDTAQYAGEINAKTGRNIAGSGLILNDGNIPANAVYVRSPENNAVVWAWGAVSDVEIDVRLHRLKDGTYEIAGADWILAESVWANNLTGAIQPPLDTTRYSNILIPSLSSGMVYPSPAGGLNVRISAHYYIDGGGVQVFYPDEADLDLTSSVPGTADEWGWVKVGMDRTTNTAIVIGVSTPKSITAELTEDELAAIALGGDTPHGGIRLRNGQTSIPYERGDLVDCRAYF
jgi:hypothetical protein